MRRIAFVVLLLASAAPAWGAREFYLATDGDDAIPGPVDKPVRGLVFKGLTFSLADRGAWTKDDAGIQHDWEMVDKADALIRFRGAEKCQIIDCTFTNSGGSAIRLDLHCQGNRIAGNEIAHIGGAGVLLIGYGPGTKDVNKGNTVESNYIHDIENPRCASCIRTDDAQKGTLVEENIVFRAKIGGVAPKWENHFVNNFLIDVGPGGDCIHTSGKWGPFGKSRIERNIMVNTSRNGRFWGGFQAQHVGKLKDCAIDRNIYFHTEAKAPADINNEKFLAALKKSGHDAHSHYGDPLFVDYKNADFRFCKDSPAIKMGIVPLDLKSVGLTKDFPKRFKARKIAPALSR